MKYSLPVMGAGLAISLATATAVMAGNCDALPKATQLQALLGSAPNIVGPPSEARLEVSSTERVCGEL